MIRLSFVPSGLHHSIEPVQPRSFTTLYVRRRSNHLSMVLEHSGRPSGLSLRRLSTQIAFLKCSMRTFSGGKYHRCQPPCIELSPPSAVLPHCKPSFLCHANGLLFVAAMCCVLRRVANHMNATSAKEMASIM